MAESDRQASTAAIVERHGHAWNAKHCATCGSLLVGCHGCCELRCRTCDPYTDYERLNRCCTVSEPLRVPAREQEGRADTRPSTDRSAAQGLHGKYHGLRRTRDNSEVEGWYFVIREGDEAGKAALLAYADACEGYAPELAADLRQRVHEERLMDGLYEAGWER